MAEYVQTLAGTGLYGNEPVLFFVFFWFVFMVTSLFAVKNVIITLIVVTITIVISRVYSHGY